MAFLRKRYCAFLAKTLSKYGPKQERITKMFRVIKTIDTADGRVDLEGIYTLRELKKAVAALAEDCVSIHVHAMKTGSLREVAFQAANDNDPQQ